MAPRVIKVIRAHKEFREEAFKVPREIQEILAPKGQ